MDRTDRKISTNNLAKKLALTTRETLSCLFQEGYLESVENNFKITEKGFQNGAEYRYSDKFKQYIVWPETWIEEVSRLGIYCCECKEIVKPSPVDGKRIYPDKPNLHSKSFWLCIHCENHVGCYGTDGESRRPLGCIGTPALRSKRKLLHQKIDPLWKSGKIEQRDLYKLIGNKLGYGWEYHTGHIRTLNVVDEVFDIVASIESELKAT